MTGAIWVFLGGGLGSLARWGLSGWVARQFGETFPWGTLVVNVTGSFVIGCLAGWTGPDGRGLMPVGVRQFLMLGVCGGYTTFSSFSLQTLALIEDGQWLRAGANAGLSVVLCLAAVVLGQMAVTAPWAGWRS
ncbi:MAG: fluoride efflux transporter CrcB [Verrucomicrobiae bacterium]|nr:fluoride efflux transporter CrcB [Verrucomicrobiae bacterium]